MKWLEENFKWPLVGCGTIIGLIIVLLVILVTDFPPLPLKKTILALISKLSARLKSSSGLSPEMISESKPQNERNTVIFLSVVTFFFLRYLLDQYKRKVFEDLPFGEILFELYKTDQNPSDPLMPILE